MPAKFALSGKKTPRCWVSRRTCSNPQKSSLPYTLVQSANCPAAFLQLTDTLCRRTSANAADSPHLPRHFPLYIYTTGILQFSNSVWWLIRKTAETQSQTAPKNNPFFPAPAAKFPVRPSFLGTPSLSSISAPEKPAVERNVPKRSLSNPPAFRFIKTSMDTGCFYF